MPYFARFLQSRGSRDFQKLFSTVILTFGENLSSMFSFQNLTLRLFSKKVHSVSDDGMLSIYFKNKGAFI